MTETTTTTAGIDTPKAWLDMALHGSAGNQRFANDGPGWRALAAELSKAGVRRVGIEATGGYERGVVNHLRQAGFTARPAATAGPRLCQGPPAPGEERCPRCRPYRRLCCHPRSPGNLWRFPPRRPAHLREQTEDDIARLKVRLEHVDDPR